MRTTAGPVPAERTKMSAPAGLWTIWDLKVEGKAGCAATTCSETATSESASRLVDMILERRSIQFSFGCAVSINITSAGWRTLAGGEMGDGECKCQGKGEAG